MAKRMRQSNGTLYSLSIARSNLSGTDINPMIRNIPHRRTKQSGFTLIELMITIAIVAVLTAVAIPSFSTMRDRNSVTTEANKLLSSILFARSEAIKRESPVVIRRGISWNARWYVFNDLNGNSSYQAASERPRLLDSRQPGSKVTIAGGGVTTRFLRFNSRGRTSVTMTNADFITLSRGNAKSCILFSASGRPRVVRNTASNVDSCI